MVNQSIIFFDGVCHLCHASIQFIIKYDKKQQFKFASLQSEIAKSFLSETNIDLNQLNSLVFLLNEKSYTQSTAVIKIAQQLGGLFKVLIILYIIPEKFRNKLYQQVAKNRYKWFGKSNQCMVPNEIQSALFLK